MRTRTSKLARLLTAGAAVGALAFGSVACEGEAEVEGENGGEVETTPTETETEVEVETPAEELPAT